MKKLWLWLFGMAALFLTHLFALSSAAGFHYDEAWAALFSHRIATEPGFWPIAAMSPYTSPWSHYFTALFFKFFGTDLFIYRASGIALVALGISLFSLALKIAKQPLAASLLPWVVAFFSAATLNHRFVIEINTFHVLCLGLICAGTSTKLFKLQQDRSVIENLGSDFAILAGILLGITSHVLFLAPALALLVVCFWNDVFLQGTRSRILSGVALTGLSVFFLKIFFGIPEKDKATALLLIACICWIGILFPKLTSHLVHFVRSKAQSLVLGVFLLGTSVSGLFLLFFSEGSWAAAFFNAGKSDLRLMIFPLLFLGGAFFFASTHLKSLIASDARWQKIFTWTALTLILTLCLATKPAPRYFEIPFLLLACGFALALSYCSTKRRSVLLFFWILSGSLQLAFNYFVPALAGEVPERSFRFLVFRDNSSDTLQKQRLARVLSENGCRFEQIQSDDPRLMEPLKFLSLGDWAAKGSCRFGEKISIQRESQASPQASASENRVSVGPFLISKTL